MYGDENRFLQVIINFLSNSLKFSNTGSKIRIFLRILEEQTLSKQAPLPVMPKSSVKDLSHVKLSVSASQEDLNVSKSQAQILKSNLFQHSNKESLGSSVIISDEV